MGCHLINEYSFSEACRCKARNVSAKRPSDFFFRVLLSVLTVVRILLGSDEPLHLTGRTSLAMGAQYRGGVILHVDGVLVLVLS